MNNPYASPKSPVQPEEESPAINDVTYLKVTVVPATIALGTLQWALLAFTYSEKSLAYNISATLSTLFYCAGIMFLLHKMANQVTSAGVTRYFGIWGFLWRALVAKIISIPIVAIGMWASRANTHAAKDSPLFAALSGGLMLLAATPVIWALFSNNRKLQLYWLSRHLGG